MVFSLRLSSLVFRSFLGWDVLKGHNEVHAVTTTGVSCMECMMLGGIIFTFDNTQPREYDMYLRSDIS